MLDHVAVNVTDLEGAKRFYAQALEPLGYTLTLEVGGFLGFGDGRLNFGVMRRDPTGGGHVAFSTDRAGVDAFHAAAVAAGGEDNGPPGIRAHYHEHYYAAFIRDADGNNIEAVCHTPE
jgi:catechol 2,3-dioxygenase-like lactoylglutathione lyase family enzyme